jgi:hypothetical protein
VPESRGRKAAEDKAVIKRKSESATKSQENRSRRAALESPGWVAPTFIAVGLLGVLWLVVYYVASAYVPFMGDLGGWNILIGMGLMTAAFAIATQWK